MIRTKYPKDFFNVFSETFFENAIPRNKPMIDMALMVKSNFQSIIKLTKNASVKMANTEE